MTKPIKQKSTNAKQKLEQRKKKTKKNKKLYWLSFCAQFLTGQLALLFGADKPIAALFAIFFLIGWILCWLPTNIKKSRENKRYSTVRAWLVVILFLFSQILVICFPHGEHFINVLFLNFEVIAINIFIF